MASQVNVTLTPSDGAYARILRLNPNNHSVPIGRASKSVNKGLMAAVDNAWFDSPVMSRDHAEIFLNSDNTVMIQDIGSMHGTYVNHSRLDKEPVEVEDGDTIVFGAEVRRGPEVFMACAFEVNYEVIPWNPAKSTNTFSCIDSLDVEDEEGEFNDEDMINEESRSDYNASTESPPTKMSDAIEAIDLTGDDAPVIPSSLAEENTISSSRSIEESVMTSFGGGPSDLDNNTDNVPVSMRTSSPPILIESDAGDSHSSSNSDDSEISDLDDDESSSFHEDDDQEEREIKSTGSRGPESVLNEVGSQYVSSAPSVAQLAASGRSEAYSNLESNVESLDDDSDNQSDFGLSDAGAEAIQSLFEDGLLSSSAETPYPGEQRESSEKADISSSNLMQELPTELPSALLTGRPPSPSDAAMVKTVTPVSHTMNETSSIVKVSQISNRSPRLPTIQSLGDKTGKHAFFEARERNRSIYHAVLKEKTGNSSTSSEEANTLSFSEVFEEARKGLHTTGGTTISHPKLTDSGQKPISISKRSQGQLGRPYLTFAAPNAISFLDNHADVSHIDKEASPELDMTSAVKYNESKASIFASKALTRAQPARSGLSIDDIIDRATASEHSNNLKRKADDISQAIENEVRMWASSPPVQVSEQIASYRPKNRTVALVDAPQSRPTKRLRRFAEAVGYAALGGAAVGATLFSALILTAPEF
ncbi:hypothetical protein B7494_g233 [Chlorociboria aeruginascens]|nr:hypothetical protein B7494_g233 [Chlorociboria aeruginascens]